MNERFAEEILEKHFSKIIEETVIEICNENFDKVFDAYKFKVDKIYSKNTTLGFVYKDLEFICLKQVQAIINEYWNQLDVFQFCDSQNPFYNSIKDLLTSFNYYYELKGFVQCYVGYEWDEKQRQLFKKGVVDEDGDYIENDNL